MFIHSSIEQVDDLDALQRLALAIAWLRLSRTWLNLPFFAKLAVDKSRLGTALISAVIRQMIESHHNLSGVLRESQQGKTIFT